MIYLSKFEFSRCEYTFEKNLPSDNRGFAKFVSHSELRHPQLNLLPSDTLTILCEISISGESVVTSGTSKSVMTHYQMSEIFIVFYYCQTCSSEGRESG